MARQVSVVDSALRAMFPQDYDKRCMYAAFGLRVLLREAGVNAKIIGGDFVAFVVARTEKRAGMEGFGFGEEYPSHYWVETEDTLVDLGPHYLPRASSYPAAKMPIVTWRTDEPLPLYLRYRTRIRYGPDVELASDAAITARMCDFLEQCANCKNARLGQPKLPSWVLTGTSSLVSAAERGDVWARNAMRFSRVARAEELPF